MINFEKIDSESIDLQINITECDAYALKLEDTLIGYGKINNDLSNKIEIFIVPEYRGNGYATQLFNNLISEIKDTKYIYLTFQNTNIIAKRIVEKKGGKQESINNGIVRYILPINIE